MDLTDAKFGRLDAHQHFWIFDPEAYPWIAPGSGLDRDFLPSHLEAEGAAWGVDGSIAVQARQSLEESRWLLSLADQHPSIRGVVGWVDLQSAAIEEQLAELAPHPKFVGVRHVVQDEPDPEFLLRPAFLRGIEKLHRFGLTYDLLLYPEQLPAATELARRFPEQRFVLDHLAKPRIRDRAIERWGEDLRKLAALPNVWAKLSGLVTEAGDWRYLGHGRASDFTPYLSLALKAFGPERLMWGSDWPVCRTAAQYSEVLTIVEDFTWSLPEQARADIFGGNAGRFYAVP